MYRRRRRTREIPFSFDSFLDVVANVVGIIIRLILVAWVGARSYQSLAVAPTRAPATATAVSTAEPVDPLQEELTRHRRELAEAQEALLRQLRNVDAARTETRSLEAQLGAMDEQDRVLDRRQAEAREAFDQGKAATATAFATLEELRHKRERLAEEARRIARLPPLGKVLRYRTPVSKPLQAEEFLFECQNGRVAFIDIGSLLAEVKGAMEEKGQLLKTRWQVEDTTGPAGAFRLHYVVERERGAMDGMLPEAGPDRHGSYRYGLSGWVIEPVAALRGETLAEALAEGSQFRRIVDRIDPEQGAVTFWVYPESFDLFRRLRDYLYQRDLVVAGRPLPAGVPIASSRHGSASRGQ